MNIQEAAKDYAKCEDKNGEESICTSDAEAFEDGAEWQRRRAIEAHWKCCPNLSKDNDQMCRYLGDCDWKCQYMNDFINKILKNVSYMEREKDALERPKRLLHCESNMSHLLFSKTF